MEYFGANALISLVSHTVFVCITFWSLQALRTDQWIKKHHVPQARLLYVLLSIAIGYTVSSFFLEFITSSRSLIYLF